MISKSEKCPALSGRALLCLFVSGCEEVRIRNIIANISICSTFNHRSFLTSYITLDKDYTYSCHSISTGILTVICWRDAGTGDAGVKLEALKAGKGFYIGFFHVNFTLLSQNQRPNSPPIQSLIGLEGLTVRVVS